MFSSLTSAIKQCTQVSSPQRFNITCKYIMNRRMLSISRRDVIFDLPPQYLRGMASSEFDESTMQRTGVFFDSQTGKPLSNRIMNSNEKFEIKEFDLIDNKYTVMWGDGVTSHYSKDWVEDQVSRLRQTSVHVSRDRVLWRDLTEDQVRNSSSLTLSFHDSLSEEGMSHMLSALYKYGIFLVTKTPVDDGGCGVAALGAAVSGGSVKDSSVTSLLAGYSAGESKIILPHGTDGPLRTLFGTVWSTSSSGQAEGASVADSAYGCDSLPLHTDMTYHRDPPGLQIFTMANPAAHGGESVFADGFAVAQALHSVDHTAFEILSNNVRRYRSMDKETGWHLEANGSIISVLNGEIVAIRHNDLDRLPDLPPPELTDESEISNFYERLSDAHEAWDSLLSQDEYRLVMGLQSGDTMIVANQRCFHGRYSFWTGKNDPRSVIGCYISQDELNSRFRMEDFDVN